MPCRHAAGRGWSNGILQWRRCHWHRQEPPAFPVVWQLPRVAATGRWRWQELGAGVPVQTGACGFCIASSVCVCYVCRRVPPLASLCACTVVACCCGPHVAALLVLFSRLLAYAYVLCKLTVQYRLSSWPEMCSGSRASQFPCHTRARAQTPLGCGTCCSLCVAIPACCKLAFPYP